MDVALVKTQVKKKRTLFDHFPEEALNLKMGTPTSPLLKMAAEMMKTASADRLVGIL